MVAACSVVAGCCCDSRVAVVVMVMHVDLPTVTCFGLGASPRCLLHTVRI
jgi:hypothetical protein